MLKLSVDQILRKIKKREVFDCSVEDGSFSLHISEYVPYVCAAIHNGSNFRKSLRGNCVLSKQERWFEEDPLTGDFISSLPIRIIANDSRYEDDLNRALDNCIYEEAWGKKVWNQALAREDIHISHKKHSNFYKVIDVLIGVLEKKFKACVVFDIHSYNFKRITHVEAPMFNVGTVNINEKFRPLVWLAGILLLLEITLRNTIFKGFI